jgi:hypothetical protein
VVDPDLLRGSFEQVLTALRTSPATPLGHAVLHGDAKRPLAIILVIDDPDLAARFAAMLPALEQRLGVACESDVPTSP